MLVGLIYIYSIILILNPQNDCYGRKENIMSINYRHNFAIWVFSIKYLYPTMIYLIFVSRQPGLFSMIWVLFFFYTTRHFFDNCTQNHTISNKYHILFIFFFLPFFSFKKSCLVMIPAFVCNLKETCALTLVLETTLVVVIAPIGSWTTPQTTVLVSL